MSDIKNKSTSSYMTRLQNLFGIASKTTDFKSNIKIPYPADIRKPNEVKQQSRKRPQPVDFPDEIERLYQLYLTDVMDSPDTFKNRKERYKDLDYCYYNSAIFSMAIDLYADETTQADAQTEILKVYAKDKKLEKWINEFFKRIGITNEILKDLAFGIALYGDHFWVLTTDQEKGIQRVTPIDIYDVTERIEFNALKFKKKLFDQRWAMLVAKNTILAHLQKMLDDDGSSDYSKYFQNYLFGYKISDDIFLPPWNVIHFRRFTTKSEFYPFGRPLLINAIAPFRQLQASKNLMALSRASNFPLKHFKVKMNEGMTEVDQWNKVTEAMEEYHNLANSYSGKEKFSVDGELWTPGDLLEVEVINLDIALDKIADIELLQDNLIIATRIPKGYLITDKGSFGTSGQSLLQQSKIFGRAVFSNQTACIQGLRELILLQLAITDEFPYDSEFELSMNFPVVEQTADQLRMKTDTITLARTVIDNLSQSIGIAAEDVPTKVIKDIFAKLSFLDQEDIDFYVNSMVNAKKEKAAAGDLTPMGDGIPREGERQPPKPEKDEEDDKGDDTDNNEFNIKISKKDDEEDDEETTPKKKAKKKEEKRIQEAVSKITEDVIRRCYFNAKTENHLTEGSMNGRHYLTNQVIDPQMKMILDALTHRNRKKLNEIDRTKHEIGLMQEGIDEETQIEIIVEEEDGKVEDIERDSQTEIEVKVTPAWRGGADKKDDED